MFKNLQGIKLKKIYDVYNGIGVYSFAGFGINFYVISDGVDFWDGGFFTSPENALYLICSYLDFYDDQDFINSVKSFSGTFIDVLTLDVYINKKLSGKK